MGKTVLLLTSNTVKRDAIESVCKQLEITLKEIKPTNINSPIGGFLGMPLNAEPNKKAPTVYNPPELMIFSGMTDKDLDVFLDKYNGASIEPVLFKGTITPYNITWSPYEFILEYEKEQGAV